MPATVTVTGKIGPGITLTTQTISGVSEFDINCGNNILTVINDTAAPKRIDITAAQTITVTKSASTYVVSIS